MEDNKYNFWAEQKYTPVKIASFGTKIGGLPTYILNQEEFLWPFYTDKTTGTLVTLRFLAQIEIGKNEYAFLFLSVAPVSNEAVSVFDFENDQTAVFNSKTENGLLGVTQKVTKIEPSWLWSPEKAVSPRQPFPTVPFWIHGYDETPEKYPNFLFQIPEAPGGIETINVDMQTYVFSNNKDDIVFFNEIY